MKKIMCFLVVVILSLGLVSSVFAAAIEGDNKQDIFAQFTPICDIDVTISNSGDGATNPLTFRGLWGASGYEAAEFSALTAQYEVENFSPCELAVTMKSVVLDSETTAINFDALFTDLLTSLEFEDDSTTSCTDNLDALNGTCTIKLTSTDAAAVTFASSTKYADAAALKTVFDTFATPFALAKVTINLTSVEP